MAELAGRASVALALLEGEAQAGSTGRSEGREVPATTGSWSSITVAEFARITAIALASLEGEAQAGLRATAVASEPSSSSSSTAGIAVAELALRTAIAFTWSFQTLACLASTASPSARN